MASAEIVQQWETFPGFRFYIIKAHLDDGEIDEVVISVNSSTGVLIDPPLNQLPTDYSFSRPLSRIETETIVNTIHRDLGLQTMLPEPEIPIWKPLPEPEPDIPMLQPVSPSAFDPFAALGQAQSAVKQRSYDDTQWQIAELEDKARASEQLYDACQSSLFNVKTDRDNIKARLLNASKKLQACHSESSASKQQLGSCRSELMGMQQTNRQEIGRLKNECEACKYELDRLRMTQGSCKSEIQRLQQALQRAEDELAEISITRAMNEPGLDEEISAIAAGASPISSVSPPRSQPSMITAHYFGIDDVTFDRINGITKVHFRVSWVDDDDFGEVNLSIPMVPTMTEADLGEAALRLGVAEVKKYFDGRGIIADMADLRHAVESDLVPEVVIGL